MLRTKCNPNKSSIATWKYDPKSIIARSYTLKKRKPEAPFVIKTTSVEEHKLYELKSEFDGLVTRWINAIKYLSTEKQQKDHPAFLRIVGMGERALPFIFEEFSKRPFVAWLSALEAIVGKDITAETMSFREAVSCWLEWGKAKGYLK
jgi:hypothetical protein